MPKREDEYWAGKKEPKGRGLCPFCGSSNVSYNKKFRSWRCNKCEKSFPSPSYGPGGDFGKEARWFGKTTAGVRLEEFAEVAREERAKKRRKSGGGFSVKKTFLGLLVIALIVATIGAFAGVEPLSNAKDEVVHWFQNLADQTPEYPADIEGRVTMAEKLITLNGWENSPPENEVFWIVDISVRNNTYGHAVTAAYAVGGGKWNWVIVAGDEAYEVATILRVLDNRSSPMDVTLGKTGQTTIVFSVPKGLTLKDAQLCYQGQEPYSYGKLTGGDKVAAYDWDSKTIITEPKIEDQPIGYETEKYIVDLDTSGLYRGENAYTKDLITIEKWTGSGDKTLVFSSDKSPMVINYGYTVTSQITSSFGVGFRDERMDQILIPGVYTVLFNGNIIESTGRIELSVTATGVNWWIMIGVEP